MAFNSVNPATTGLLFFDVLNAGFKREEGNEDAEVKRQKQAMVANCVRLREAADRAGMPVFYAKPNHRPDGWDAALLYTDALAKPGVDSEKARLEQFSRRINFGGQWGSEVIDEIKPQPDDYVVLKKRWNAFHLTSLELDMRTRGVDTVVLAGSAVPVGIASTAYGARDRDLNLVIVRDACTGGTLAEQQFFMDSVFPRLGRVRTTDEAIEMIRTGTAGKP
jgi:ureidoacrylate peracid hydrolase